MKQQNTPTLKPIKPGLYYLDYTDCAKINAHDDLVAALRATLANVCQAHGLPPRIEAQARAALANVSRKEVI